MELYQGCLNKQEYATLKKELKGFVEIGLNERIDEIALKLSQEYALSHKMSIPDTLIAATALVYELQLYTYNLKDFRFIPTLKVSNELVI
jgi:tRNA(fMet)-specific endonuclease VapC